MDPLQLIILPCDSTLVVMHPDVAKLVEAGRIPQNVGERLSEIAPGKFCMHKSWGAGKVLDWDFSTGKITIDFEKKQAAQMDLKFAMQKTESLDADHFSAQKINALDELRILAVTDPVELVRQIVESQGGTIKFDQLEREIIESIVPEADYKKWWDKTKKAMRESHKFTVPSKRTEPIVLRCESMTPAEMLVADFESARDLKGKVKALEAINKHVDVLKGQEEALQRLTHDINEACTKGRKIQLGKVLELLVGRDLMLEQVEQLEISGSELRLADVLTMERERITESLKGLPAATQRRIYETFPDAFGDEWKNEILSVFDEVGSRGVSEIAKYLDDQNEETLLLEHLRIAIKNRRLGPDALVWVCRERKKVAAPVFDLETGNSVLNLLERDMVADGPSRSGRLRNLLTADQTLISDLLADADDVEARNFGRKLYQSPVFTDLDRKSLMARVIKARPETQAVVTGGVKEDDEDATVSSWGSIEKRKGELEHLVKVLIPENVKEISVARSYGDLKENFEYKAAKDMQAVLSKRKHQMELALSNVKGSDFVGAKTDVVNIGTVVGLIGVDGSEKEFTILGAWDSVPDQNILSYLTEIGKALLGKAIGDTVVLRDLETEIEGTFTIKTISAYAQ